MPWLRLEPIERSVHPLGFIAFAGKCAARLSRFSGYLHNPTTAGMEASALQSGRDLIRGGCACTVDTVAVAIAIKSFKINSPFT